MKLVQNPVREEEESIVEDPPAKKKKKKKKNAYTALHIKKNYAMRFPKITVKGIFCNRFPWLTDAIKESTTEEQNL